MDASQIDKLEVSIIRHWLKTKGWMMSNCEISFNNRLEWSKGCTKLKRVKWLMYQVAKVLAEIR